MGYNLIHWKVYKPAYLLLLCLGLLLRSCEREDISHSNYGMPATFTPTMGSTTRVDNNIWSGTETVGIYSVMNGGTLPANAIFKTYKPSGTGTRVQLNPTTKDQTVYYPTDGTEVNFIAFAPYTEVPYSIRSGNVVTYTLNDQTTKEKIEKLDLIYHKDNTVYSESNPVAVLQFEHKLSRIIINITRGANFVHHLTGITDFRIQNVPTSAACNLATGTVTASSPNTISPYNATNLAEISIYQAVMPAHTANTYANRQISFILGGNTYIYSLEQDFEAGSSYSYNFTLTPQGIIPTGSTVAPWGAGTVAWSGDYYLGVSENTVALYKEATNNNTLTLTTNHSSIPVVNKSSNAITVDGNCSWITLGSITGSSSPYTHTYNIAENTTGIIRQGYLHVTVGTMTTVVKVEQNYTNNPVKTLDGNANCFMVAPGSTVRFPLNRPIAQGTAASNAIFTVEKLWDDATSGALSDISISGTGSNAYVRLTAGTTSGNAVIAAKVNGIIVWSYHIWVVNYDPNIGGTFTNTLNTNNNGKHFIFMDRNLGATEAAISLAGRGLMYQWGRKDPFPGGKTGTAGYSQLSKFKGMVGSGSTAKSVVSSSANAGAISESIKNPTTFYSYKNTTYYDWLPVRDDKMWGHGNTTAKSVYDPCPIGWRIPSFNVAANVFPSNETQSPWYGVINPNTWTIGSDTGGISNWGTNALYPAAGFRSNDNGSYGVEVNGYWSASPYSSSEYYGTYLYFHNAGSVAVRGNLQRSIALSVRCIKI